MDPRRSFRAIARNLGIDELTVRNRLRKLHRMGFLKGWHLFVNPSLLGLNMVELLVDVRSSSKEDLIEKLRLLPGIVAIIGHLGNSMYVVFAYQDEGSLEKEVTLIEQLAGGKSSQRLSARFPHCSVGLSQTDAEIVRALARDPRKMYSGVAKELGFSSRTVKRRLERMIEGKAVFVIPSIDPSALEGAMVADLLVQYSGREGRDVVNQRILSELDDCVIRAVMGDPDYGLFNLIITRVSAVREIPKRVASFAGVASARVDVVQDRLEMYDEFSELLEGPEIPRSRATPAYGLPPLRYALPRTVRRNRTGNRGETQNRRE
jgi:DNA-binding Lrp family transcriptional regulator